MSDKVDKSIERTSFYHMETDPPDNCPQCNQRLLQEYGPYLVATRSGPYLNDEFMISGGFGYLCAECATAVIHIPKLLEMLSFASEGELDWEADMIAKLGLVNLDAIPLDQIDIPFDELENFPLVPFHAGEIAKKKRALRRKRPKKPKRRRKK